MRQHVLSKVTHKFPSLLWDPINSSNGLHENVIGHAGLGDPDSTEQMNPLAMHGLFECATFVRT